MKQETNTNSNETSKKLLEPVFWNTYMKAHQVIQLWPKRAASKVTSDRKLLQNIKVDKAPISEQGRQFSTASHRWQPFLHTIASPPLPYHRRAIFYQLEQYYHRILSHLFLYFSPAWAFSLWLWLPNFHLSLMMCGPGRRVLRNWKMSSASQGL